MSRTLRIVEIFPSSFRSISWLAVEYGTDSGAYGKCWRGSGRDGAENLDGHRKGWDAMPTKMQTLYTGMSGHLATMSEFLSLGYNAAIPEVDRGDDVFVVRDDDGNLSRIQVKTANARTTQYGYRATVNVPRLQLETPRSPEVYYVFPVRHESRWKDFVVISREDLFTIWMATNMGSLAGPVPAKQKLVIQLAFRPNSVRTGTADFQPYRNNWNRYWPTIVH
jgi:hypothetical protein